MITIECQADLDEVCRTTEEGLSAIKKDLMRDIDKAIRLAVMDTVELKTLCYSRVIDFLNQLQSSRDPNTGLILDFSRVDALKTEMRNDESISKRLHTKFFKREISELFKGE